MPGSERFQRRELPERPDPLPIAGRRHPLPPGRRGAPLRAAARRRPSSGRPRSGITRIVQVGCDVEGSPVGGRGGERWPSPWSRAWPSIPTTPPGWADALPAALDVVEDLARHPRVRAVGETGLDYYRTRDPAGHAPATGGLRRATSRWPPHTTGRWSIHDRDAHADILDVLDAEGPPDRIVMHCFSGDADFARACLDRGAYLSFAGTVTFKPNDRALRAALRGRPAGPDPGRDRRALSDPDAVPRPAQRLLSHPAHRPVHGRGARGGPRRCSATPWPTTPTPPSAGPGRTPYGAERGAAPAADGRARTTPTGRCPPRSWTRSAPPPSARRRPGSPRASRCWCWTANASVAGFWVLTAERAAAPGCRACAPRRC